MSVSDVGPTASIEGHEKCRCLGCSSDIPIGLKIPYCTYCKVKCMEPDQRKTNRKITLFGFFLWVPIWLAGLCSGMIWTVLRRGFSSGVELVKDLEDSMPMWNEEEHHRS